MLEQNYKDLILENQLLHKENAQLKCDNDERIKCEIILNAAMEDALLQSHPSDEIQHFLASIGQSLDVGRIYIFEEDPDGEGLNNTYEWCSERETPQIDNLQKVPFEAAAWWYERFEKGQDIHIPDLEAIKDKEPITYSVLKPQGVNTLIAKRLMQGDHIVGFFGVDNPKVELMADVSYFLDTMSNFLAALIRNRNIYLSIEARYVSELEEKNAALNEALHKAEDASAAKSQFLSSMSHDIRTPLNAIIGMTAIAKDHIDDKDRVNDCLKKITVSSKYLLGLINDVLDMAKIESGKMSLYMEDMSLGEALDSVSTITRFQSKERNQHYELNIHDIISDHVMCDSLRLNQILLNLLSNAVKFTPEEGTINVDLYQERSEKGDDHVLTHLKVTDNGIGMSPEFMQTIFDSFSREESKVRKTQGTGLGMAITKSIVDAMGGTIEVTSKQGCGSTFFITLDLKKGASDDDKGNNPEAIMTSLDGMRILLAEDNDINAEIAVTVLEENGASVTRCEDGQIAVKCFESSDPDEYDAILMDLRMPNMDGLEAARAIRSSQRPDAAVIPIIAMTADAFSDDIQNCMNAGMNAHVAKPFDVEVLKKTLIRLSHK